MCMIRKLRRRMSIVLVACIYSSVLCNGKEIKTHLAGLSALLAVPLVFWSDQITTGLCLFPRLELSRSPLSQPFVRSTIAFRFHGFQTVLAHQKCMNPYISQYLLTYICILMLPVYRNHTLTVNSQRHYELNRELGAYAANHSTTK